MSADQVIIEYTMNKPGVNGGMGVSLGTKWPVKFYAEGCSWATIGIRIFCRRAETPTVRCASKRD